MSVFRITSLPRRFHSHLFAAQSRAFDVLVCIDLLGQLEAIGKRHHFVALLCKLCHHLQIVPLVDLGANQNNWDIGAIVADLVDPMCPNIVEARFVYSGEADQEDVCVGIRKWAEASIWRKEDTDRSDR